MALSTVRARRANALTPVGRLRLPRRATLARLVAVAALLLTAAAVLYAGGQDDGSAAPRARPAPAGTDPADDQPDPQRTPAPLPDGSPEPGSEPWPGPWPAPSSTDAVDAATPLDRLPVPAGRVGVPARLADPTGLALLRPGDRVDLFAVEDGGPVELAVGAIVLATDLPSGALLLAVTPAESRTVLATPATAVLPVLLPP